MRDYFNTIPTDFEASAFHEYPIKQFSDDVSKCNRYQKSIHRCLNSRSLQSMVFTTMVKSGETFISDVDTSDGYYRGPDRPRNIMTPVTDSQPLRAAV